MRLNALQWLWMAAVLAWAGALLLDIVGAINPSPLLLLAGSGILLLTGRVMPSMAELRRMNRRG